MMCSRMYLNAHFFSDTFASLIIVHSIYIIVVNMQNKIKDKRLLEENNCPTVWINIVKVNDKKRRIMLPLDYQDDFFAIYLDYNDNDDVDRLMFDIYNACLQKKEIELEITFNI